MTGRFQEKYNVYVIDVIQENVKPEKNVHFWGAFLKCWKW